MTSGRTPGKPTSRVFSTVETDAILDLGDSNRYAIEMHESSQIGYALRMWRDTNFGRLRLNKVPREFRVLEAGSASEGTSFFRWRFLKLRIVPRRGYIPQPRV